MSADRGHAAVLGAGITGLLAARVLSTTFDRVTIVERDDTPAGDPRRGVPQGRHLHGLLDRGRQIMEQLYPGLVAELTAAGALTVEPLRDTRWYLHGRRLAPTSTGLRSVLAGRPFLESALRSRTLELPGVDLCAPATAVALVPRDRSRAVGGVRVRSGSGPEHVLRTDLVVDASGRGSRLPDWLTALGHPKPAEQRVDIDLGYSSQFYRREPGQLDEHLGATVSTVPRSRGGGAMAIEGDRWMITLAGLLGDHPPADHAEFVAWAASLPAPDVHRVASTAVPLGDPVPYRFRGSRWRRYDRTPPPEGVLALGDAVCSLNPLYAQGMTLAAQQVLLLSQHLDRPRFSTAGFQRAAARPCGAAWDIATRADLALPEVSGSRPWHARLLDAYVTRVQLAAHHDPAVARRFLRVANLTDPPATLLRPDVVVRVLRAGRGEPDPAAELVADPVNGDREHR